MENLKEKAEAELYKKGIVGLANIDHKMVLDAQIQLLEVSAIQSQILYATPIALLIKVNISSRQETEDRVDLPEMLQANMRHDLRAIVHREMLRLNDYINSYRDM